MRVTKTSFKTAILTVVLVGMAVAVGRLEAQDPRALLQQGIQAFNDFDPDRALPLLRRGVNPTAGRQDSLWAVGVQYIVQTLFDQGQAAQAGVWARWGMRLAPTMRLDEVNLVSEVIDSLEAGRAAGAAQPGDALTTTAYSWPSGDPGDGQGRVDITPVRLPVPVNVLVVGGGVVVAGRGLALAPGSYLIRTSAQGYQTVEVTREVLPGVTTVVSFNLRPVAAVAEGELPSDVRDAVLGRVASLMVRRFGTDAVCGAGAFVGRNGLLLTTYSVVRGADRVDVTLGSQRVTQDVRVAAYDAGADVAVLAVPMSGTDSLPLAAAIADGQYAWGVAFPNCSSPSEERLRVSSWENRPTGELVLSDSVANAVFGSPLFDQQGALVGLSTGGRSALPAPRVTALLDRARQNVSAQRTQTFAQVGSTENHIFGSVAITSSLRNAVARVTPLEDWHWPELGQTSFVPLTYAGAEGRYRLELTVNGRVQRTVEFTLRPGVADRLAVNPEQVAEQPRAAIESQEAGGGFPWIIAVLGAVGAGAAGVFLLGGGGDTTTTVTPGTGTITIRIPNRD